MTTSTDKSDERSDAVDTIPTAIVSQRRSLVQSKFWILTFLALLLAIGLAWSSMPERGTRISIHFPDGHGLHPGDPVRYRGINVGTVREIRLSDRDGVDVQAEMDSSADQLLKEKSRFWIVRPQLALTGVSGLETAVGPKYVAVEPGESSENEVRSHEFEGLSQPPATFVNGGGVEIVLRGDKQFSVRPGSSVSYRGFEVGRILDVQLSDDARFVDLRATIKQPYLRLVNSKTKFWANSGVDVDFSLRGGLSLDTESLETIARGGVSFVTLGNDGVEVVDGQVFVLHEQMDEEWLNQANRVRLPTVDLKGAVTLVIKSTRSGLLGKRNVTRLASAVPVRVNAGQTGILIPTSLLSDFVPDKNTVESVTIDGFSSDSFDQALLEKMQRLAASDSNEPRTSEIVVVPLDQGAQLPWQALTTPGDVSAVVAVRRPVGAREGLFVHQPINASQLTELSDGTLSVTGFEGDYELWNGSPILSTDSGDVIGCLVYSGSQLRIVPANKLIDRPIR